MEVFKQRVRATIDAVPAIRRDVRSFLRRRGVSDESTLHAIALAVTEAVANVVRHAYPGGSGDVEVTAERRASHVEIQVRDAGVGIQEASAAPGAGYGLQIIRSEASDCAVHTGGRGTTVDLRFDL